MSQQITKNLQTKHKQRIEMGAISILFITLFTRPKPSFAPQKLKKKIQDIQSHQDSLQFLLEMN
jgi:hypothetical protein